MSKYPRLLCVDPGKKAGYSISDGSGKIVESGVCDGDDLKIMRTIVISSKPDVLCVESQFIRGNTQGIMTLIERQHNWRVLCRLNGVERDHRIDPAMWQSHFSLSADRSIENKHQRSVDFKRRVDELAKFLYKNDDIVPNETDAILINYFILDIGISELERREKERACKRKARKKRKRAKLKAKKMKT